LAQDGIGRKRLSGLAKAREAGFQRHGPEGGIRKYSANISESRLPLTSAGTGCEIVRGFRIAAGFGVREPVLCDRAVFLDALTESRQQTDESCGARKPLLRGLAIPLRRLCIVFRDAPAIQIGLAQSLFGYAHSVVRESPPKFLEVRGFFVVMKRAYDIATLRE